MAKTSLLKKEIEQSLMLYDRREVVTAPLWPHGQSSLFTIYTSSNQPHHQKIYYRTVYTDINRTGSMDVDFSIAYGHFIGSGSSSGSFGLIATSSASGQRFPVSESMAIYSQYRSLMYDYDKSKYISDGKFRFYGLTNANFGMYDWGFTSQSFFNPSDIIGTFKAYRPNNTATPIDAGEKVQIPGVTSFALKEIISTSFRRFQSISGLKLLPYVAQYHFINIEGRLFQALKIQPPGSNPASEISTTIKEAGFTKSWKEVATGRNHMIAIASDGTLWGWGDNEYAQLGLGYVNSIGNQDAINSYFINIENNIPIQIGTQNNWEKVYAGSYSSFAINSDGELYAWGSDTGDGSSTGILGLGTLGVDYYTPTKVGSNTWNMISIGMTSGTDSGNGNDVYMTAFGIDTSGKLWGWGNDVFSKLNLGGSFVASPTILNSDEDWIDISSGATHVIAIKGIDRKLVGWGYSGPNGELLASAMNDTSPATQYTVTNRQNIVDPSIAIEWVEIKCGDDFSAAITSDRRMWNWGNNQYGQLFYDSTFENSLPFQTYMDYLVTASNFTGWDKLALGPYYSVGAINYPEENVFSMPTDDIYVININRWNFRDKMDSGTLQLGLRTVFTGSTGTGLLYQSSPGVEPIYRTISLVDESINLYGTHHANPMYDVNSKGGMVYGLFSGSLKKGIHESAADSPYGIFLPENGIIILNGEILRNEIGRKSITIQTRRTPATSSGGFPTSSNADMLYTSISGAMQLGMPFIANTVETKIPTYFFVRINNDEFNHTLNPSFYDDADTRLVKDKLTTVAYPFTYITTIGLYTDDDELLAVAKLSRPILKTPSTELVIKVKLDI